MSKQTKNVQKEKSSEIVERLVAINRVSKTVKGGKNMSFSALVVVGDKNGRVGFGKGNAAEVSDAKNKAFEAAKKAMAKVSLKEGRTIHHDVFARFCSAKVYLRSAPSGTGVIAGGPMRAIFECAGIHDIVAKSVGTSNPYNMVGATFNALKKLISPKIIAEKRAKEISEIIRRRNAALKIEPKNLS
ncbi:MAG: 30S ribosomal protein S5 [Alphaproteobacteria bacterium RIFCSPLOWO2_01_FULL_40_26]|nr:MAG: 30S ribosomal protein S5 [Alphaproteobacteria bacterium RIFCSPHIGHO2_02_FULL_40_34]OFW87858.1 MAG: 30S ribosomal protein S5 [Alphaproteobacteria bacterium RIFCSPHIGHO2_01_FULL_40_8]OFW95093.1 MAG: 30S ribosomal protein S5 [Alphaproteobacteria bacterium RIFCSPLOWO2_01_FULL_40_26]OFX09084.1 MAG: 30S ribosomal protein S5 [Alphaproteobacteria bacterium RIFCSPLOWO2_02_FULL_40_19]OFX12174.1 MAG: 30S ribosomal protein S5 [Alphaproteobacteria bacterium RIFCSPLOWO2_12_FULL_40_11]